MGAFRIVLGIPLARGFTAHHLQENTGKTGAGSGSIETVIEQCIGSSLAKLYLQ